MLDLNPITTQNMRTFIVFGPLLLIMLNHMLPKQYRTDSILFSNWLFYAFV